MMTLQALLEISGLTVTSRTSGGDIPLVRGVDLRIDRGERLALVGESGSGKSLIARSIMRLNRNLLIHGSVRLDGVELLDLSETAINEVRRQRISMVMQDPMASLNPRMTIGEQVAEPLRISGVSRREAWARAIKILDEVGIADAPRRARAYPHELSGGMRQRALIAAALISEPELLIADEPTTALDVRVQRQVLELLYRVTADRGLAVLLITHDLSVVAGFADRVATMYAGRKVNENQVDEIFARPSHPYTQSLLAAIPRLDDPAAALTPIPGSPPRPGALPSGCAFHPRCSRAMSVCETTDPGMTVTEAGEQFACHRPLVTSPESLS